MSSEEGAEHGHPEFIVLAPLAARKNLVTGDSQIADILHADALREPAAPAPITDKPLAQAIDAQRARIDGWHDRLFLMVARACRSRSS